jgi:hypothetical protein
MNFERALSVSCLDFLLAGVELDLEELVRVGVLGHG